MMAKATFYFPDNFLWGTTTAAHQVEGGNTNNDWWRWEQEEGRIKDGASSETACGWWQNAEADLDRMAELGQNAHRLSLEWSRIEPREGQWDEAAIDIDHANGENEKQEEEEIADFPHQAPQPQPDGVAEQEHQNRKRGQKIAPAPHADPAQRHQPGLLGPGVQAVVPNNPLNLSA